MAKEDQQYFVAVEVTWGKQNGEVQTVESRGGQNWGSLTYDQSVSVQNGAVIPGIVTIFEMAGELGLYGMSDQEAANVLRNLIKDKK